LRGEHYERRLNNELEASFERERMHRKVIEDLSKSLETRNAENQSLKKALEEAHAEVATVKRELQLQEAFCEDLRSRLAEDRVLTLL
jgi:chromosome segregation ATPase